MNIPDSHAHLTDSKFCEDREEVIERARGAGVFPIMVPCEPFEYPLGKKIRERYSFIHLSLGLHPHNSKRWGQDIKDFIEKEASSGNVLAIGEIGLDYHYDFSPRDRQRDVLKFQLEIAERKSLPVIIHSRESAEDIIKILSQYDVIGVLHSFSEEPWLAEEALAMGYYISFSGMITFRWGEEIREVAKKVPLDRVLVETDSPYLGPVPFRGRRNEPAFVLKVAEKLCEIQNINLDELARALNKNYSALFGGGYGEFEEKDKADRREGL